MTTTPRPAAGRRLGVGWGGGEGSSQVGCLGGLGCARIILIMEGFGVGRRAVKNKIGGRITLTVRPSGHLITGKDKIVVGVGGEGEGKFRELRNLEN